MDTFTCGQCGATVEMEAFGTKHRNHCPKCLWSKHLDKELPGDRKSDCLGMMKPIGLSFKREGNEKGELMVVHSCMKCAEIEKNRVAGDDESEVLESLYRDSLKLTAEECVEIAGRQIVLADEADEREVLIQLYGKPEAEKRMVDS